MKARWPEVAMVIILQVAMMVLIEQVTVVSEIGQPQSATLPFWASFLLGVGMMLFVIVWQMVYLGFLKTAAVSGDHPQHPMQLLHCGRPYFWRILFFQILLGVAVFFLNSMLISLLVMTFWPEGGMEQVPEWGLQIIGLVGVCVLLKPMLLVPAVILVYDVTAIEAIFRMWKFQFFQIESILKVTIAGFGFIIVTALLTALAKTGTPLYHILTTLHHGIFSLVLLLLTLMAILWTQQQYEAEYVQVEEVDA